VRFTVPLQPNGDHAGHAAVFKHHAGVVFPDAGLGRRRLPDTKFDALRYRSGERLRATMLVAGAVPTHHGAAAVWRL
jgi:hypothetical protein